MKNTLLTALTASFFVLLPISATAQPLKVVATFSILADMSKQIGGDDITVRPLVPPGSDAHVYKPTPGDSRALAEADVVIANGLGFEGWIDRMVSASGFKGRVAVASEGVKPRHGNEDDEHESEHQHGHEHGTDPHAWQDVSNARIYAKNIAAALTAALPAKAGAIAARAKAYDARLETLDKAIKADFKSVPQSSRKIITSHDAFGYFSAAYNVSFLAPQGLNTEIEPTARQIATLIEQMKTEKIRRVFFESMASPLLIERLAKDAGASVGKPVYSDTLSPPDGPAPTYEAMMAYNAAQFKEAMTLNGK
ncbi:MAG: zinc ABC transporter substrate-binding protein [Alphaproteobacteria bacterium]|nr:zinc ABC transporter substrate-binding protein [Alphaproteobacteria bacterium]